MRNIYAKLEKLSSFLDQFHKKKLVLFIGKKGVKIIVYDKDETINSLFLNYQQENLIQACCDFLKNYTHYQVIILLDSPESQQKHDFIPMIQSILKFNPIEKFIGENYKPEDLIAYNVYNIDYTNGEVWETVIASSEYTPILSQLLEFVIDKPFYYKGTYFLSLEIETITNAILQKQSGNNLADEFQIFIAITETSHIRIAAKHKKNILDEGTFEIPPDKSEAYIAGIIENVVTDKLLKYKSYINSLDLKVALVLLCSSTLLKIFFETPSLQGCSLISHHNDAQEDLPPEVQLVETQKSQYVDGAYNSFYDQQLVDIFIKEKSYIATNKFLTSITTLTVINSVIFKPLIITALIIVAMLGNLKYQDMKTGFETYQLNNKYYTISEQYRNIKKKHPEIENINNLTELYNLENILSKPIPTPIKFLLKLLSVNLPNIELESVNWYSRDAESKSSAAIIQLNCESSKKDVNEAKSFIENYILELKKLFPNEEINFDKTYPDMFELPKKITIPVRIEILSHSEEQ